MLWGSGIIRVTIYNACLCAMHANLMQMGLQVNKVLLAHNYISLTYFRGSVPKISLCRIFCNFPDYFDGMVLMHEYVAIQCHFKGPHQYKPITITPQHPNTPPPSHQNNLDRCRLIWKQKNVCFSWMHPATSNYVSNTKPMCRYYRTNTIPSQHCNNMLPDNSWVKCMCSCSTICDLSG